MTQALANTEAQSPRKEIQRVIDTSEFANLLDTNKFEHMYRVASLFSDSTMIPEHYRKQIGNCFIAIQMAVRMGVDPFHFMQRSYVVHGKPGIEAQLAIALINTSGLFENSLDYEIHCDDADGNPFDPSYRVRAFATHKATGKMVLGPWVDWPLVDGEGWAKRDGSKWKTMPGIMFRYRAATFFGRLHCPERLAGMNTADELDEIRVVDVVPTDEEPGKRRSLKGLAEGKLPPLPPEVVQNSKAADKQTTPGAAGGTSLSSPAQTTAPMQPGAADSHNAPGSGRPKAIQQTVQQAGADAPSGNAGVKSSEPTAMPVPTDKPDTSAPPAAEDEHVFALDTPAPPAPPAPAKMTTAERRQKAAALARAMTPEQRTSFLMETAGMDPDAGPAEKKARDALVKAKTILKFPTPLDIAALSEEDRHRLTGQTHYYLLAD